MAGAELLLILQQLEDKRTAGQCEPAADDHHGRQRNLEQRRADNRRQERCSSELRQT